MPLSICVGVLFLLSLNVLLFFGTESLIKTAEKNGRKEISEYVSTQNYVMANHVMTSGLSAYKAAAATQESDSLIREIELMANDLGGRVLLINRRYRIVTDTYHQNENKYYVTSRLMNCLSGKKISTRVVGTDYLEVMTPLSDLDTGEIRGAIITTASLREHNAKIQYLYKQREVLMGIFFIVSFALFLIIVLMIRHPFHRIQNELDSVVAGHQDTHLSESRFKEFDRIAQAFNQISERNQKLEDTRQEFVSNVSHELKTPITSMKILADSLVMQENVPLEIYKEFMEDIVHEVDRESQIISDLLELVKMDKTKADLAVETANINELLEELLKRISPIAEKRDIQIRLETMRDVTAEVDRGKLSMALTNLIENAVKYNKDGGKVSVSLNADHKFFYIRVKDTGVGIPEDCHELIFDRFYRVDKARSRDTGGTGLGLAITRNIVLLHKGSIKVNSKVGEGSTFTVRIPLKYL